MGKISLAAARINAGYSQENVAKLLGVNKASISNWERGKTAPDADRFKQLCDLYNWPMDDIFLKRLSL